jgi:hypothetical protein
VHWARRAQTAERPQLELRPDDPSPVHLERYSITAGLGGRGVSFIACRHLAAMMVPLRQARSGFNESDSPPRPVFPPSGVPAPSCALTHAPTRSGRATCPGARRGQFRRRGRSRSSSHSIRSLRCERSIIPGQVDSYPRSGDALPAASLRGSDPAVVSLAEGVVAPFAATTLAMYPKAQFPAQQVYASHSYRALQLVTCGGLFDRDTGHYLSNIVAYTCLVATSGDCPRRCYCGIRQPELVVATTRLASRCCSTPAGPGPGQLGCRTARRWPLLRDRTLYVSDGRLAPCRVARPRRAG